MASVGRDVAEDDWDDAGVICFMRSQQDVRLTKNALSWTGLPSELQVRGQQSLAIDSHTPAFRHFCINPAILLISSRSTLTLRVAQYTESL